MLFASNLEPSRLEHIFDHVEMFNMQYLQTKVFGYWGKLNILLMSNQDRVFLIIIDALVLFLISSTFFVY